MNYSQPLHRAISHVHEAEGPTANPIAAPGDADSIYLEWRRLHATGMRSDQERRIPQYERTRTMRIYCSTVIPAGRYSPEGSDS